MAFHPPNPEHDRDRRENGGLATLVQAEKLMQIALLIPCAVFVGWLLGAWLGPKLHLPWLSIAGMIFGGISGLVYVVRLVLASGSKGGRQ